MTRGYLLDTNIIEFWFNPACPEHELVLRHIDDLDSVCPLATSVIVLGEIIYGYQVAPKQRREYVTEVIRFTRTQLPRVLPVKLSTTDIYGQLRAKLFEKFAPKNGRKRLRPEQLVDPVSSLDLGIHENDLWIASQAIEHNLVLVTSDKMEHIRVVASELMVENWAVSSDG